jgi:hypothetical protein
LRQLLGACLAAGALVQRRALRPAVGAIVHLLNIDRAAADTMGGAIGGARSGLPPARGEVPC